MLSKFVDVWQGRLALADETMPKLHAVLDQAERQKAQLLKFPVSRNRFIAVRALLRQTLAGYLEVDPASLRFETGAFGKPHLACGSLQFNLSHTADHLLIAVANFPDVGIDIESIQRRDRLDALATRVFSDRELSLWRQLPPEHQLMSFYRLWTKKEAFVKAVGRGIALGMELCEFSLEPEGQVKAIPAEYGKASDWLVTELEVSPDLKAALVTACCDFELHRREIRFV